MHSIAAAVEDAATKESRGREEVEQRKERMVKMFPKPPPPAVKLKDN